MAFDDLALFIMIVSVFVTLLSCFIGCWFRIKTIENNDLHALEGKIHAVEKRIMIRLETVSEETNNRLDDLNNKLADARERLKKLEGDIIWLKNNRKK